jgi:lysophospholipase L1-like esterase
MGGRALLYADMPTRSGKGFFATKATCSHQREGAAARDRVQLGMNSSQGRCPMGRVRRVLLAMCIALGVALFTLEIGSRLFLRMKFGNPLETYHHFGYERQPLLGFEMTPNVRNKYAAGLLTTYSTNSQGFRGTEEFGPKQRDELRIVLLGESCVFGYGASGDGATIAGYLEQRLRARATDRPVTIVNAGHPGYTSYQILARLQLRVLELQPDVVVLYMGWNDLFFSSFTLPYRRNGFYGEDIYFDMGSWQAIISERNQRWPLLFRPFAATLALTIWQDSRRQRQTTFGPGVIDGPVGEGIQAQLYDNLSSTVAILRYRHVNVALITLFSEYDLFGKNRAGMNAIIRRVAAESGSTLIDADDLVTSEGVKGINNPVDRYHLTDAGNRYVAGLIAAWLEGAYGG